MINLRDPDSLPEAVRLELESLVSQLRNFLDVSFDDEGNVRSVPPTGSVEVGMVFDYAGATPPNRYLVCDGSAVSRVTFKALYERIGTVYGPGDSNTTFNLPDCRGRASYGQALTGTGSTLGETFGAMDHNHTVGAHTHSISADGGHSHGGGTSSAGGHSHTYSGTTSYDTQSPQHRDLGAADVETPCEPHSHTYSGTTDSVGDHSHGISSDGSHAHGGSTGSSSGGSTGTENPPGIVFTKMIYVGVETVL